MQIDPWTFGFQAANFLVLVWLLHRFLYKPVLKIIAARQAAADKLIADVKAEKAAAEALRQDLEIQKAGIAKQRDATLNEARAAADAERKALMAKAQADADAVKANAQKAFERERAGVVAQAGRDAARLAVSIVKRLLRETSGAPVQDLMLDRLCEDVAALPAESKQHIVERLTANGDGPRVVTAEALDARAAKRFTERLGKALGAPVKPKFKVDAGLLAGVEVHFPFTILRRSWSEDLKRIEAEIVDDDHAQKVA